MLNTGISAVLGLGYWLIAAHYYSPSAVGQGSAAIAAMKLLAGLTAVTLTGALARFIPVAGRATGRLIFRTYAGSSVVVALGRRDLPADAERLGTLVPLPARAGQRLGFVLAIVAWNVLTLQDGVLTGLRSAPWVPVGNTVFSAVKLALLVGLRVGDRRRAVSSCRGSPRSRSPWCRSAGWCSGGWCPGTSRRPRSTRSRRRCGRSGGSSPGDYTGSLFSLAVVYLVPVIIASQVSSEDNAYFYITTTIGGTVNLLAINMGASLTVEGSHDPARSPPTPGPRSSGWPGSCCRSAGCCSSAPRGSWACSARATRTRRRRCCAGSRWARCCGSSWRRTSRCCARRAAPPDSPGCRACCASWCSV
jgi:hypothetical protein